MFDGPLKYTICGVNNAGLNNASGDMNFTNSIVL